MDNPIVLHTDLDPEECIRRITEATVPRPSLSERFFFFRRYESRWGKGRITLINSAPFRFGVEVVKGWRSRTDLQALILPETSDQTRLECNIRRPSVLKSIGGLLLLLAIIALLPDFTSGRNLFTSASRSEAQHTLRLMSFLSVFWVYLEIVLPRIRDRKDPRVLLDFVKQTLDARGE